MRRKWSASCQKCDVFLSDGHPDGPGYLPSRSGRKVGRRANDFAAPFAGTVRQDCLDHVQGKCLTTTAPAISRKPGVNAQDR